ncbi:MULTISPECIES: phosphate acyltransferase PlsX [Aerococcus]|uniref:Phosphate acyltransferase n=1 Tax=Aerococcus viridans TaxID=1377 RepID=A0A2N6UFJ8_9LACT|nr:MULTISPECIES: phosphate acyltransferase PlsX [Aerococcus]OFU50105.1 phosphate acyltransferase [Aerococcus sp. HMSC10H05]PMC80327.1 phosphate acyltransferase PlsX [Aerococcus viridans]
MRIAVDAMGGDNAPKAIVLGGLKAAAERKDVTIMFYGDEEAIKAEIEGPTPENVEIIHAGDKILSEDDPVRAVRTKRESSMVMAARAVRNGEADALISAGNTGALLTAGLLVVGRMKGVERPALMAALPNLANIGDSVLLIDCGANAESKASYLNQYAVMATAYARAVLKKAAPSVGLLNNGTEENKGNDLTKEAFGLLKANDQINFTGNIESREILNGVSDIVVADGFTGNAVLKSVEGTAAAVMKLVKNAIMDGGISAKLGGLLIKGSLKELMTKIDLDQAGGGILFGVKAPVLKAHGSSNATSVFHTILQAVTIVESGIIEELATTFEKEMPVKKAE